MPDPVPAGGVRVLASVGAAWGLALLTRPQSVVQGVCPELPPSRRWAVPLLGARLVVQHGLLLARPSPSLLRAATVLDAAHAASMLPLLPDTRYRRAAGASGGIAAVSAAVTAVMAHRGTGGSTQGTGARPSPV